MGLFLGRWVRALRAALWAAVRRWYAASVRRPERTEVRYALASRRRRVVAFGFDLFLRMTAVVLGLGVAQAVFVVLSLVFYVSDVVYYVILTAFMLAFLLPTVSVQLLLQARTGQSLGKRIMRLRIVGVGDGRDMYYRGSNSARLTGHVAAGLLLMPLFLLDSVFLLRRDKRALHNLLTGTIVVDERRVVVAERGRGSRRGLFDMKALGILDDGVMIDLSEERMRYLGLGAYGDGSAAVDDVAGEVGDERLPVEKRALLEVGGELGLGGEAGERRLLFIEGARRDDAAL